MVRRTILLTGCALLALAPVATHAGGMLVRPVASGFGGQVGFRSSAFGSPGGFPFMAVPDHRDRVSSPAARRPVRHVVVPSFPVTSFLYAPSVPYALSTDASSPTVNVSPVTYVSPTVYVSLPGAAAAPPPLAAPPPPPSTPSVVEYATGRYELRGDGVATPYAWVWIPNPPAAPPVSFTSREETPAATSSSAARSQVYRWTDEQGTEFWTNRLEKIPEPYRSRAGTQAQLAAQQ